jgi:tetratricopeptide (TPR) repeat protein
MSPTRCIKFAILLLTAVLPVMVYAQPPGNEAEQQYKKGIAFKEKRRYKEALSAFKQAVYLRSDYPEAWFEMGWCQNEQGNYKDAIHALNKAAVYRKDMPKLFFELGYAFEKNGDTDKALEAFGRCILLNKEYAPAYKHIGQLQYVVYKNYLAALDAFSNYVQYSKDSLSDAVIFYRKGWCENKQQKFADAEVSLRMALRLDPGFYEAYTELGFACYQLNKDDEAIGFYNESLRIKADNVAAYIGLGELYRLRRKNYAEAMLHYEKALDYNPQSKKANYELGCCYNETKAYDNAIVLLKNALEADKYFTPALNQLGYAYYEKSQYKKALHYLKKSLDLDHTGELPRYYSGRCYIRLKKRPEARQMLNELKKMNSSYSDTLQHLLNSRSRE